jgi:hypothetical protein
VFKPENIGEKMSIDDKGIVHAGFTILSNSDTGKIALPVRPPTAGGGKRRWKSSVMKYVYEAVGEVRLYRVTGYFS